MLTECRCGLYLSILQQYSLFQYVNVPTSALQFARVAVGSTYCTAVGRVRVRTTVSRYSMYSSRCSRYVNIAIDASVGVCSTCVSTAAEGTLVG